MLVYTNDGEWLYRLNLSEAADHPDGSFIHYGNDSIKQVKHTHKVIGFQMNEFQVAVGETTFTGKYIRFLIYVESYIVVSNITLRILFR